MADDAKQIVEDAVRPLWPAFESDPATLSDGQRAVMLAWTLSGLVGNGGFASWIEGAGHLAEQTLTALRLLGADEHVRLVNEALALYPTAGAATPDERLSASESWADGGEEERRLEALDEQFFRPRIRATSWPITPVNTS